MSMLIIGGLVSATTVWASGGEKNRSRLLLPLKTPGEHDEDGIRFVCPARQLQEIKVGMLSTFESLGIATGFVEVFERPGSLVYTLATAAGDTSTMDFSDRESWGIGSEQVTLPVPGGAPATVKTVSRKEIMLALLQHGRLTEFKGQSCRVDALSEQIALRQNIVAWAENLRWRWPDGGPAAWNDAYWDRGTPKPGVSLQIAFLDAFANQGLYAIGCYTATKLVFVHGVLDYYERVREDAALARKVEARLLSDREPLVDVEPSRAWRFEPGYDFREVSRPGKLLSLVDRVAPKNFVPGDWAYFLNPDPVSRQKTGFEGSNAIYLGGGRFDDYYGENNHSFTYEEKLDEVFQWRNGVYNRGRDEAKRNALSGDDLERLGLPPRDGGLLQPWRIIPDTIPGITSPTATVPVCRPRPAPVPPARRRTRGASACGDACPC